MLFSRRKKKPTSNRVLKLHYIGKGLFTPVWYKDGYEKSEGDDLNFWHPTVWLNINLWVDMRHQVKWQEVKS